MSALRDGLARRDLSSTQRMLLIIAHHVGPISNPEIKRIAVENGWRGASKLNPTEYLRRNAHCVRLPSGWELTSAGREALVKKGVISSIGILTPVTEQLDAYLLDVIDTDRAAFIAEAVACVKQKNLRAAIVLSWVGAAHILFSYIVSSKLAEFNAEGRRRNPKWKDVVDVDTVPSSVRNEAEFLNMIEHLHIVTDGEAKELVGCLNRRNIAGHPNSHSFEDVTVGHHIQTLIATVYRKF